jgi:signal transduction histidine kinase
MRLAPRWWGALAGIATSVLDTYLMSFLGVNFEINGRDATLVNLVFMALSYGPLGFLLGYVFEARRRDRKTAAVIQAQTEAIGAARARLAQSEKLSALGQLAAAIAHEVRNPLGVIRSAAQNLNETLHEDDEEGQRSCSFIIAEIDRLASVVSSLLAFARPLELKPEPVRVDDLLDRALALAAEEMRVRRIRVERRPIDGAQLVRADRDLACQLFLGLLNNAAEAAGDGAEVVLEATTHDGSVEVAVADSGPGVPLELRERIFEPFFTTRKRGTGLGLAVAKQIVEAHGGRIRVGDRAGGGACFTVSFPVAEGAAA